MKTKNSQAILGFILAFGVTIGLIIGIVRIWGWFNANYAGRSIAYQNSRALVGKAETYDKNADKNLLVNTAGTEANPGAPYIPLNLTENWVFKGIVQPIPGYAGSNLKTAEDIVSDCRKEVDNAKSCAQSVDENGNLDYENCSAYAKCVCVDTVAEGVKQIQEQINTLDGAINSMRTSADDLWRQSDDVKIKWWGGSYCQKACRKLRDAANDLRNNANDIARQQSLLKDQQAVLNNGGNCCDRLAVPGNEKKDTIVKAQNYCLTQVDDQVICVRECYKTAEDGCKGVTSPNELTAWFAKIFSSLQKMVTQQCIYTAYNICKNNCSSNVICSAVSEGQDNSECCNKVKSDYASEAKNQYDAAEKEREFAQTEHDQLNELRQESVARAIEDCFGDPLNCKKPCVKELKPECIDKCIAKFVPPAKGDAAAAKALWIENCYQQCESEILIENDNNQVKGFSPCSLVEPLADKYCEKVYCNARFDSNNKQIGVNCGFSNCVVDRDCAQKADQSCNDDCLAECKEKKQNECDAGCEGENKDKCLKDCNAKDFTSLCEDELIAKETGTGKCKKDCFDAKSKNCSNNGSDCGTSVAENRKCNSGCPLVSGKYWWNRQKIDANCETGCDLTKECEALPDSANCAACSLEKARQIQDSAVSKAVCQSDYWGKMMKKTENECCAKSDLSGQIICLEEAMIKPDCK